MSLEWAGVSAAIPLRSTRLDPQHDRAGFDAYVRDLGQQLVDGPDGWKAAAGGAQMRSQPIVRLDGPQVNDLLGVMYVLSLSAQVETDDLPTGSRFAAAFDRHAPLVSEGGEEHL